MESMRRLVFGAVVAFFTKTKSLVLNYFSNCVINKRKNDLFLILRPKNINFNFFRYEVGIAGPTGHDGCPTVGGGRRRVAAAEGAHRKTGPLFLPLPC